MEEKVGYVKFEKYSSYDNTLIEFTAGENETLDQILVRFTQFLRGCGYYFDGEVEIIENEHTEKDE